MEQVEKGKMTACGIRHDEAERDTPQATKMLREIDKQ